MLDGLAVLELDSTGFGIDFADSVFNVQSGRDTFSIGAQSGLLEDGVHISVRWRER